MKLLCSAQGQLRGAGAADLRDSLTSPEPASLPGRQHQPLPRIHSSSAGFSQEPLGGRDLLGSLWSNVSEFESHIKNICKKNVVFSPGAFQCSDVDALLILFIRKWFYRHGGDELGFHQIHLGSDWDCWPSCSGAPHWEYLDEGKREFVLGNSSELSLN